MKRLSLKSLLDLCGLQKKRIKELKREVAQKDRELWQRTEEVLVEQAEQSDRSYFIIKNLHTVVAFTPILGREFYFDSDIKGANCYKLLKSPNDLQNRDFEQVFREVGEEEFTVTMRDGKGKDRFVYLGKEAPVRVGKDFYTRIHVYQIGIVRKYTGGGLKRILKVNKQPKNFYQFVAAQKAEKIEKEARKEAEDIRSGKCGKKTNVRTVSGVDFKRKRPT